MFDKNKIEYFVFIAFVKFFNVFGIDNARYFGRVLAFIFYFIFPIRKSTVIENLRLAFPQFSSKKIRKIAYQNYLSFAVTLIEIMCIPALPAEKLKSLVDSEDIKLAEEKVKLNKGLLFLTAHFGNWEFGAVYIGLMLNKTIQVLVKPQRNSYVSEWIDKMRETFGNKVVPLGASVREIYKAILNKNIVGIVGDQRGPREGVRVQFFDQSTAVYPGAAAIALKTGTPVLVAIIIRQQDCRYKLKIEELCYDKLEGSLEDRILQFCQNYMKILEKYVRHNPEQWLWMHKIWKY